MTPMGTFKWRTHENESIDVQHGGGAARSSNEISVMGMERRGRVVCCFKLYATRNGRTYWIKQSHSVFLKPLS